MTSMAGNAAKGFPGLLGVLTGILLFTSGSGPVLGAGAALVIAYVLLLAGRYLLRWTPRVGLALIEVWITAAVAIVAISTAAILWLTVNAPAWFPVEEPQQRALSGALVGGVTAYIAVLWTQDIAAGGGPFWPSTQFRAGIQAAFAEHPKVPLGDTREYEAIYADRVRNGPTGWGFIARWRRARIISVHLSKQRNSTAAA